MKIITERLILSRWTEADTESLEVKGRQQGNRSSRTQTQRVHRHEYSTDT